MGHIPALRLLLQVTTTMVLILVSGFMVGIGSSTFNCPRVMYAFGDSLTDTGNIVNLGLVSLHHPYGESYSFPGSGNPSGRFSDGRLVIDFFAQAFRIPFPRPIFAAKHPGEPGFEHGANFAYGGATAALDSYQTPITLSVEVDQFLQFKLAPRFPSYVGFTEFRTAFYVISEIGANDFIDAYSSGLTPSQAIAATIPLAVNAVRTAMERLYTSGARHFLVFNAPPVGCTPYFLTLYGTKERTIDESGCLTEYNQVVKLYNARVRTALVRFWTRWPEANVLLFDTYGAMEAVLRNPEAYGFREDKLLFACCGYGGQHNYNPAVRCGDSGNVVDPITNVSTFVNISTACDDPKKYVIWDGLHPTQALNRQLAIFLVTGRFVEGPAGTVNLSSLCDLDFTKF